MLCAPQLTYSITHLVFTKAAFDTRAMEPVSVLATYPLILIARGKLPANNLSEFLAYAQANPGKVNYGHQGKGNTGHLLGELLMLKGDFRMTEIPVSRQRARDQRSARPATSTSFPTICSPTSRTSTPASSNSWRPAAASGIKDYPNVATIAETLPGVYADTWMAVAAPPGTPKEITQEISDAIGQGFKTAGSAQAHPGAGGRAARQLARADARDDRGQHGALGAGDRGGQDHHRMNRKRTSHDDSGGDDAMILG